MGHGVDVVENGGAGGGETRHCFKESVDHRWNVSAEQERQHANQRKREPCRGYHNTCLAAARLGGTPPDKQQSAGDCSANTGRDNERHEVAVAVGQSHDGRNRKQKRFHRDEQPQHIGYHTEVHRHVARGR